MIILGECTEEANAISVDEHTEDFCIAVFGFFPHGLSDNLFYFLREELNVTPADTLDSFEFGGNKYLTTYSVSDSRTFDESYVFPMTFESKEDALNFIESAIKSSSWVFLDNFFNEIQILDAYKVTELIENQKDQERAMKMAKETLSQEMNAFREKLEQKYASNPAMLHLIETSAIGKQALSLYST